jgi:hypothetical protein
MHAPLESGHCYRPSGAGGTDFDADQCRGRGHLGFTGLQAIAALRAVFGQDFPALLITDDTAPDRLREALSGNIPLLHKPVSPDQLYLGLVTVLMK